MCRLKNEILAGLSNVYQVFRMTFSAVCPLFQLYWAVKSCYEVEALGGENIVWKIINFKRDCVSPCVCSVSF